MPAPITSRPPRTSFVGRASGWLDPLWRAAPAEAPPIRPRQFFRLFVPLFSVNLLVLALCAPQIKVDGHVYATLVLKDFVIPHAAPLYPLLIRFINAVVHNAGLLAGLAPVAEGSTWSLHRPMPYSNASIYAILLLQHLLLASAASWFALSVTRVRWLRFAIAGVLGWSPPILIAAQRIQTEGLWNPLVIASVATCYRFLADPAPRWRNLALHFGFLGLAMLTRHPGSVFLAVLPTAVVVIGFARATTHRSFRWFRSHAGIAIGLACLGLLLLKVVTATKDVVMIANGVEPRSSYGRPGTQRIHYTRLHPYERMSPQDLEEVVQGLELRAPNPLVQRAIRMIATSDSVWSQAFQRVRVEIVQPEHPEMSTPQVLAQTDRLLNQVARLAYTSSDPRMQLSVVLRTLRFLQLGQGLHAQGHRPPRSLGEELERATRVRQRAWLLRDGLIRVTAARDVDRYRRTLALEWSARVARPWETRFLWLLTAVLVPWTILRGRFGLGASVGSAAVAAAVIYAALSSVVANYSARRSEVIVLLAVCGAGLMLTELIRERSPDQPPGPALD